MYSILVHTLPGTLAVLMMIGTIFPSVTEALMSSSEAIEIDDAPVTSTYLADATATQIPGHKPRVSLLNQ